MAEGTIKNSLASLAISITGVAGPGGGTSVNPVGTVYIASIIDDKKDVKKFNFQDKGRDFIRRASGVLIKETISSFEKRLISIS